MEKLVQELETLIKLPCFTGSKEPIIFFHEGEFKLV